MEFIIVTGMSGAGKSKAMDALEDIGYFCVDNIPPGLLSKFVELCIQSEGNVSKVAIVMDIRGGDLYETFSKGLIDLGSIVVDYKILFLDCSDEILIRRYKESRRRHPLAEIMGLDINGCIIKEREILLPLREQANLILDTSLLSLAQLKERITDLFLGDSSLGMHIHCTSFGFKYGTPNEADLIFDVRCLPNPFYIEQLKYKTGLEPEVYNYVLGSKKTTGFIKRLYSLIDYMIPLYVEEGKCQVVIAIGCTGGKHRSVTIAEQISKHLTEKSLKTTIFHRDINKN
jgi:Predicted P-loop-containing kinase